VGGDWVAINEAYTIEVSRQLMASKMYNAPKVDMDKRNTKSLCFVFCGEYHHIVLDDIMVDLIR